MNPFIINSTVFIKLSSSVWKYTSYVNIMNLLYIYQFLKLSILIFWTCVLRTLWCLFHHKYKKYTVCRILTTTLTHCLPLGVEVACKLQYTAADVGLATVVLVSWSGALCMAEFPLMCWKTLVSWDPHLISHPVR
jgi:hypothetical protein